MANPTIWVTERIICLLAAEAGRSVTTVREVLRGRGSAQSRDAVARAAQRLNIELPAPRTTAPGAPLGIEAHGVRSQLR